MGSFYSKIRLKSDLHSIKVQTRLVQKLKDPNYKAISILRFGSSKNECENLCRTRGEKFPSIFDLTTQTIDSETPEVIWTDGIFDYNNEIWTDSLGKAIPDELWENSAWLRKEFHVLWAII